MPNSTVIKTNMDGALTLSDGSGLSLVVPFDQGNFGVAGLAKSLRDVSAFQTRGVLRSLRHGARNFPSGSFSAMMSHFSSATATGLADIILRNGYYAAATSTQGANADVYTLNMAFTDEGTNFGDSSDHSFALADCYLTLDWAEGEPNMFTVNWTCYGAVTGDLAI
jgi:hypothetical protein